MAKPAIATILLLAVTALVVDEQAFIVLPEPTPIQIRRLNQQLGVDPDYVPANLSHSVRALFHRPEVAPELLRMDTQVRGTLSKRRYAIVAVVVSSQNRCGYCLAPAKRVFLRETQDKELLATLLINPTTPTLPADERAIVRFAIKLTQEPESMEVGDVVALRNAGLSDRDIFDLNLVVSWLNFMNRMSRGLGYGPDAGHPFDPMDPLNLTGSEGTLKK